jgi:hypothetical protein
VWPPSGGKRDTPALLSCNVKTKNPPQTSVHTRQTARCDHIVTNDHGPVGCGPRQTHNGLRATPRHRTPTPVKSQPNCHNEVGDTLNTNLLRAMNRTDLSARRVSTRHVGHRI